MIYRLYATKGSGNCFKPFLAFTQLSIPFETIEVDVLSGQTHSPLFRAMNPAASVPYLRTPDGVGLSESNAMLWLIADGSALMPATALETAQSLQWMFFEQSKLEPFISPARFLLSIAPDRGIGRDAEIARWQERALSGLEILDNHLSHSDFMIGARYGITDIAIYGYVHLMEEAAIDIAAFPAIDQWINRVKSTPEYVPIAQLCAGAVSFAVESAG